MEQRPGAGLLPQPARLVPEHPWLQVPPTGPRHPLPAVYSDLVNWGDWSLMSSRKIRTS